MAKYAVNKAYNLVPVKVESDNYSNALKGDIVGVSAAEAHLAIKAGNASLVPHPKDTETYEVEVSDAGIVAPVGMKATAPAPAA